MRPGNTNLPPHASLRAVFAHSWELLSEAERQALGRLSVFRGGFTRGAAAQVARASLEMLSTLADKSLVRRDAGVASSGGMPPLASGRCSVHELLQQFAGEALKQVLATQIRGAPTEAMAVLRPMLAAATQARARGRGNGAVHAFMALASAAWRHLLCVTRSVGADSRPDSLALIAALPDSLEKAFALVLGSYDQALPPSQAQALSRQALAVFQRAGHRWGQAFAQLVWADVTRSAAALTPRLRKGIGPRSRSSSSWATAGARHCA